MRTSAGDLEIVLEDIERALQAQLWYMALAVTLSIPDICSLLQRDEQTDGWPKEEKYVRWFDTFMGPKYGFFSGQDCYRVRGGVLHKGRFGHPKAKYDRVLFGVPGGRRIRELLSENNGGIMETALHLDLVTFCQEMIDCARSWYIMMKDDPNVKANMPYLVRFRPYGVSPHIVGVPIIA